MRKLIFYTTIFVAGILLVGLYLGAINAALRSCNTLIEPFMTIQEENTVGIVTVVSIVPVYIGVLSMLYAGYDED